MEGCSCCLGGPERSKCVVDWRLHSGRGVPSAPVVLDRGHRRVGGAVRRTHSRASATAGLPGVDRHPQPDLARPALSRGAGLTAPTSTTKPEHAQWPTWTEVSICCAAGYPTCGGDQASRRTDRQDLEAIENSGGCHIASNACSAMDNKRRPGGPNACRKSVTVALRRPPLLRRSSNGRPALRAPSGTAADQ